MSHPVFDKLFQKYPKTLQIQTVTGCNAECVVCPTGISPQRTKHEYLPMHLWEKIIRECSEWESPIHSIIPSLFNEPTIDKRLFDMIDMAKEQLPTTTFFLVTNGSLLVEKNVERILSSGFDSIRVSVNAYHRESFIRLGSALDFDRIVAGTKQLLEKSRAIGKPTVIVSMVETQPNTEEVQPFTDFWKDLGAEVHVSPAWNRAGNLPLENDFRLEPTGKAQQLCSKPMVTMPITYDGDVVFCCGDYSSGIVLGNIKDDKLLDIWMGTEHQVALIKMLKGENHLCNRCDKLSSFRTYEDRVLLEEDA